MEKKMVVIVKLLIYFARLIEKLKKHRLAFKIYRWVYTNSDRINEKEEAYLLTTSILSLLPYEEAVLFHKDLTKALNNDRNELCHSLGFLISISSANYIRVSRGIDYGEDEKNLNYWLTEGNKYYQKAISVQSDDPVIDLGTVYKCNSYIALEKYEELITECNRLIDYRRRINTASNSQRDFFEMQHITLSMFIGKAYIGLNQLEDAFHIYSTIKEKVKQYRLDDSYTIHIDYGIGRYYEGNKDFEKALLYYESSLNRLDNYELVLDLNQFNNFRDKLIKRIETVKATSKKEE